MRESRGSVLIIAHNVIASKKIERENPKKNKKDEQKFCHILFVREFFAFVLIIDNNAMKESDKKQRT